MKSIYLFISLVFLGSLTSCDDGDIILDPGFTFESDDLESCNTDGSPEVENDGNSVFFNINTTTNEVIAFELNNRYNLTTASVLPGGQDFPVENNNFSYRKFASRVTSNYFCSGIPDASIDITTELRGDRGTITITTLNVSELDSDDDGDGIPNDEEGFDIDEERPIFPDGTVLVGNDLSIFLDTDDDGIPDFKDIDDDNDNVLTRNETMRNDEGEFADTDGDGIPNYLDDDDDGDMILTRNEITAGRPFPDSEGNTRVDVFFYLDDQSTNMMESDTLLINTRQDSFRTSVNVSFLGLSDGNNTISKDELDLGELIRRREISSDEEATTAP